MPKARRITLIIAPLIFLFLSSAVAWAGVEPLYVPEPIPSKGLDKLKLQSALRNTLVKRAWRVQNVGTQTIRATFAAPGPDGAMRQAVVDVIYGGDSVRILYHASEQLQYNNQANTIDSTYNEWIRAMEKQFQEALSGTP